jgi:hypothetical protein
LLLLLLLLLLLGGGVGSSSPQHMIRLVEVEVRRDDGSTNTPEEAVSSTWIGMSDQS